MVTTMLPYCNTQAVVNHDYNKTKKLCIDPNYESDFYFYYDALSQTNHAETLDWMQIQGCLKYWALPMLRLNAGTT